MNTFTLHRSTPDSTGCFGVILDGFGVVQCATAEHAYNDGQGNWSPKVPVGNYQCILGQHQLHSGPIQTFEITNIPGHTGILFHQGNFPQVDSDGCILIGTKISGNMLIQSDAALQKMLALWGTEDFMLQVE